MTNQEALEQLEYAKGIINRQGKDYLDERDFPVLECAIETLGKNGLKNWRRNMNHGFKLHPDGTLELTMPKDKKVTRVLVCQTGTQNAKLFYPESYYCEMWREINERLDKSSECKRCCRYGVRHDGSCSAVGC